MIRLAGAAPLALAFLTVAASADTDGTAGTPPRTCLQLAAAPEAPRRPSGREVRIVTYTVVNTLRVQGEVGHPAFFVFPHERERTAGCELLARAAGEGPSRRGRGDARR